MEKQPIQKYNNFDLIRLLLAFTVFLVHSFILSKNPELSFITSFLSAEVAVNCFFVISGFLVSMSFENSSSNNDYLIKRVRRIYPAYVCVILFSVIVGTWLTNLSVWQYLSIDILKYLVANLSFLNLLQLTLPGVFSNNNVAAVNGALWSIRFEVLFYLFIPILGALILKYNKKIVFISLFMLIMFSTVFLSSIAVNLQFPALRILCGILPKIFLYFICGSFLYFFYGEFQKHSVLLFIFSVTLYFFCKVNDITIFMPFFISVVVIFMACQFKYLGNWAKFGDFSYGIYIWHCPVLQTFISFGLFKKNPYAALVTAAITVFFISFLSWHVIEKKFLKRTSHYVLAANSAIQTNAESPFDKKSMTSDKRQAIN